jgi:hypothetical protein
MAPLVLVLVTLLYAGSGIPHLLILSAFHLCHDLGELARGGEKTGEGEEERGRRRRRGGSRRAEIR